MQGFKTRIKIWHKEHKSMMPSAPLWKCDFFTVDTSEMVLLFSTSLKDKNGKMIYEGDICEISNSWTVFKREVVFKGAGFGFQGTNGMFVPNKDLMRIIGNIYENPELLGE